MGPEHQAPNSRLAAEQAVGLNNMPDPDKAHEVAHAVTPVMHKVRAAEFIADQGTQRLVKAVESSLKNDERLLRGNPLAAIDKLSGQSADEVRGAFKNATTAEENAKAMQRAARAAVDQADYNYDLGRHDLPLDREELATIQEQARRDVVVENHEAKVAAQEQVLLELKQGGILRHPKKWATYLKTQHELSGARHELRAAHLSKEAMPKDVDA